MTPALTAVLLMPRSFDRLANGVACLRRQTLCAQIEVILVHSPQAAADVVPARFACFQSFRAFELPDGFSVAEGFVRAFDHGTAPVVAYIEDHVSFGPDWAEAIVAAHRGPWAAVAPAMENGNHPRSIVARTNFLMCFVEWFAPGGRFEVSHGPGHNTTYKRAALEPLRAELPRLYQSERTLCFRLESAGQRMIVEPAAVTRHVNISRFWSAMVHSYCGGKIFGAERARLMSRGETVARTLLAPLVPAVRLVRIIRILLARHRLAESGLVASLPSLLVGLGAHAVGEVGGYWGDATQAEHTYRSFESDRLGCVVARDRAILLGAPPP